MNKEPFHISMLGSSFAVRTDEDPRYLRQLVSFVEERIQRIEENMGSREPLRSAILSSILIADELFQERMKSERAEEATDRLIQFLNEELP
ncbi:cell division protein ZapA [Sediminispirochaeta bajacaliforniensis]|uniref:cell division protein ZapA n=1 Tax=Sediminispirochaeta bajacaliforniensis TaxID=148 RepID=UPI001FE1459E|nr:cell division protein ZapA [Sediminispirochaeta bajacaliforniensis]